MRDVARRYREQGLRPVPLEWMQKKPAIRDWPAFDPTDDAITRYFGPDTNVGLLTCDGLTDIDLDMPEAIALAPVFLPDTRWLHGRKSAPSSHYMYMSPGCTTRMFVDPVDGTMLVELRADGCQTLVPPSVHPSGEPVLQEREGVPSSVPFDQLSAQVHRLAAATVFSRHYPSNGSRHHWTNALAGMLIRGGWTEKDVLHFITAVARAASDEEWQERRRNVATTAKRIVEGSPCTGAPTLAGLTPPEVVRTAGQWLGFEWNSSQVEEVEGGGAQPVASRSGAPRGELPLISLGDLFNKPDEEIPWLVKDRLPAGGSSMIVAKPKVGKTTLARALALAVSRGEPWLGWQTTQGPVVYLALEEKERGVKEHFRAMGATGEEPLRLLVGPSPGNLVAQLARTAEHERPVLIIIDTLQRLIRAKDLNDYSEVNRLLEPLDLIAKDTGAHIMLVHHARKGPVAKDGDSVLGSTAIMGGIDTIIQLSRGERCRTLWSTQRSGEDLEEVVFELDLESRIPSLGESREAFDGGRLEAAILSALRDAPGTLTEKEIDRRVNGRTGLKRAALRSLFDQKAIDRVGTGTRGDSYRYFRPLKLTLLKCWPAPESK